MHITAIEWKRYTDRLRQISDKAAMLMQQYVLRNGYEVDQKMIDFAYGLATKYGEAAGALACEMYDNMAAYWALTSAERLVVAAAQPAPTATYAETAKAVYGSAKQSPQYIQQSVGRLVKQVAADTTLQNADRDGAQFAWIPRGDTCAFCIMLASRGWQRQGKKAMKDGHAEHIHANCDCAYAIRFSERDDVEGYDPDRYLDMYEGAEGTKWQDKLNSMRREFYAEDKDRINAQKRASYAQRRAMESELDEQA